VYFFIADVNVTSGLLSLFVHFIKLLCRDLNLANGCSVSSLLQ